MPQVKRSDDQKLDRGLPLTIRSGHTVRLETTHEPMTVHTGLALFYAMAEALGIPQSLDRHVRVKVREASYPESEHLLALAANAFVGGDSLDDLEALRADVAIQRAIGRQEIPDPTTAGDFCRRFSLGHVRQLQRAFREIVQTVYTRRPDVTTWTLDVDAKVHAVYGKRKEGAAKAYNGVYALQPFYGFVHETDELIQVELRSGRTHPGAKAVAFLRRVARLKPASVTTVHLRSDSALYNHEVVDFCEEQGWPFTITADQTRPLLAQVNALAADAWQPDPDDPTLTYAEVSYQPVGWQKAYRYLIRREQQPEPADQATMFDRYAYYIVVTNRPGPVRALMEHHDRRGTTEKRIGEFTREFLAHLPMGHFMANWVYLCCAQLGYNVALWIRDLALPTSYRKKYMKRLRRCIGLIAAKVTMSGRQVRLKISTLHRWWRDVVQAWQTIPTLRPTLESG